MHMKITLLGSDEALKQSTLDVIIIGESVQTSQVSPVQNIANKFCNFISNNFIVLTCMSPYLQLQQHVLLLEEYRSSELDTFLVSISVSNGSVS